jgi:hypothetical protein
LHQGLGEEREVVARQDRGTEGRLQENPAYVGIEKEEPRTRRNLSLEAPIGGG